MLRLAIAALAAAAAVVLARAAWRWPLRTRLRAHRHRAPARLPPRLREPLDRALRDAGTSISPEDALWIGGTTLAVCALLSAAISPPLTPVVVACVAIAMPVVLALARGRAQRAFVAALPSFVEFVAAQLRSGHTVGTALVEAVAREGPMKADGQRMLARIDLGASLDDALARWADERRVEPVRAVAGALAVASATGGAAARALDGLAQSLRDNLGAQAEAAALSAQARLSAVVVGAAPIAYLVFVAAVDPNSATMLVATSAGRVCLGLGLGLDAAGMLWMRRIARSVP